jgi:primosomal protein N' (replication factor Y)
MPPTIFNIALEVPLYRTFDYLSGDFSAQIGNRVIVSFAGRNLVGVVLAIKQSSDVPIEKLKAVSHVFEDVVFTDFKLLQFCADYYHYPFGQALVSTLPLRLRQLKPAVSHKTCVYRLATLPSEELSAKIAQIPTKKAVLHLLLTALRSTPLLAPSDAALISSSWKKAIGELKFVRLGRSAGSAGD